MVSGCALSSGLMTSIGIFSPVGGSTIYGKFLPGIGQLTPDLLHVGVAHVVEAQDEAVLELWDGLFDVLKKLVLLLARLLGHLREVIRLGSL